MFSIIVFIILVLYFAVYTPLTGRGKYEFMSKAVLSGSISRLAIYLPSVVVLWLISGVIALLSVIDGFRLSDVGLKWIAVDMSNVIFLTACVAGGVYLSYLVFKIIRLRVYAVYHVDHDEEIEEDLRAIVPVSIKEKRFWIFVSLSAGITEELIFRGFVFYMLTVFLPGVRPLFLLVPAAVIFGLGHTYQGWKNTLKLVGVGYCYGLLFVAFDSILPCILLHFLQDVSVVDLAREEETSVDSLPLDPPQGGVES